MGARSASIGTPPGANSRNVFSRLQPLSPDARIRYLGTVKRFIGGFSFRVSVLASRIDMHRAAWPTHVHPGVNVERRGVRPGENGLCMSYSSAVPCAITRKRSALIAASYRMTLSFGMPMLKSAAPIALRPPTRQRLSQPFAYDPRFRTSSSAKTACPRASNGSVTVDNGALSVGRDNQQPHRTLLISPAGGSESTHRAWMPGTSAVCQAISL